MQALFRGKKSRRSLAQLVSQVQYPFVVKVIGASGIHYGDGSVPSPLAVLTVHDGNTHAKNMQLFLFRTPTVRQATSPEWNAAFLVPGAMANCSICLTLFDSKGTTRKAFLGQAVLRLDDSNILRDGGSFTLPLEPVSSVIYFLVKVQRGEQGLRRWGGGRGT